MSDSADAVAKCFAPKYCASIDALHALLLTLADDSVFGVEETSPKWRTYLETLPPRQRSVATAHHRVIGSFRKAQQRGDCIYCWAPIPLCLCLRLKRHLQDLNSIGATSKARIQITMILHSEEFMRTSNTGHIAALVLDATLHVEGLSDPDPFLSTLDPRRDFLLYPSADCVSLSDVFEEVMNRKLEVEDQIDEGPVLPTEAPRCHFLLVDSTWNQAKGVHRHVAKSIKRVGLDIDPSYVSMFAPLRKQTRSTGVSTLEATRIAIQQMALQMERSSGHGSTEPPWSIALQTAMNRGMELLVDLMRLLRCQTVVFNADIASLEEVNAHRAERQRAVEQQRRLQDADVLRKLLPPPVSNFCDVCDRVVGFDKMVDHVCGSSHRRMLERRSLAPS